MTDNRPFIRSHGYDPRGVDGDRRHNRDMKRCPGRGCLTMIPADKTKCQFCTRSGR